jgi:hypothetical protein
MSQVLGRCNKYFEIGETFKLTLGLGLRYVTKDLDSETHNIFTQYMNQQAVESIRG